jgi:hypothetical protein
MDDELIVKGGKPESFLSYITTISTLEKNELLNVIQYIVLIVIPLVLFLKFMKEYIPPDSASKSSIEITAEVVIQLSLIFIAFWFIHKVTMYIPTYSTVPYEKLNLIQIAMPVIFLLFCMKSSISEKVSILLDRFMTLTGIRTEPMEDKKKQQAQRQPPPNQAMTHALNPMNQAMAPLTQPMTPNPPPMNTSREGMEMNMNYGISEPMASTEMGSPFGAY